MELRPDVVAGKYDPSLFDPSGYQLLVNEIFYSIQGEGAHAGEACVFIRLAKCNLACKFCDTEFETGAMHTVETIMEKVKALLPIGENTVQVTLTGGEPMLQNCQQLVYQLQDRGHYVTMETSGSVWSEWAAEVDWITVSPKLKLKDISDKVMSHAKEFKWIVNDAFLAMFQANWKQCWVAGAVKNYLQPEWGPKREKFTTAAIKLIQRYPNIYRLSLQQHKLAGVP